MARFVEGQPENGSGLQHLQSLNKERNPTGSNESSLSNERIEHIERWRNAPEWVEDYDAGVFTDLQGNVIYGYEAGSRLYIQDDPKTPPKEVMDTCQTPWAFLTVDKAFEELGSRERGVKVLERGFGMGIAARRVIQDLVPRDGTYTVIELNRGVADYARRIWRPRQLRALTNMASGIRATRPDIDIEIIEGEAYEETKKLTEAGRKFDIIISDTFPLTEDERGVNDILDLETLKNCLEPDGVFAFFAHFPGSTGDMSRRQLSLVIEHFRSYDARSRAEINPPPDYKYLQPDTGPVRSLPVVICKNPIL